MNDNEYVFLVIFQLLLNFIFISVIGIAWLNRHKTKTQVLKRLNLCVILSIFAPFIAIYFFSISIHNLSIIIISAVQIFLAWVFLRGLIKELGTSSGEGE